MEDCHPILLGCHPRTGFELANPNFFYCTNFWWGTSYFTIHEFGCCDQNSTGNTWTCYSKAFRAFSEITLVRTRLAKLTDKFAKLDNIGLVRPVIKLSEIFNRQSSNNHLP